MTTGVDTVKELRERTGAGIMDCKTALKECAGDIEKSIDFLRKKGMASAAKRAGREAKEGLVTVLVEGKKAVIAETNCETDFVARTDDFKSLAVLAMQEVISQGEAAISGEKVTQKVAELSGKLGEKILVRRAKLVPAGQGVFFHYVHSNQKLGVLVELQASKTESLKNPLFEELGKNISMQVAASNPICRVRAEVPAVIIEREKAIFREEVKGKPDNIVEKIVLGKLDKFYQSQCLLEQPFIKDDKQSVQQLIAETGKKLGDTVELKQFIRFQLGENVSA